MQVQFKTLHLSSIIALKITINIYQNPYTGEILAIRSQQWRIWDLMWGLHIMDWTERDNIGNIFLKIFSFIALFTAATGIILFFKRK